MFVYRCILFGIIYFFLVFRSIFVSLKMAIHPTLKDSRKFKILFQSLSKPFNLCLSPKEADFTKLFSIIDKIFVSHVEDQ